MKIRTPFRWLLILALPLSGLTNAASAQSNDPPELGHDFRPAWRLGVPALAFEEYPAPVRREPLLFAGRMKPRGTLVLRSPGNLSATPPERRRLLRSSGVNITTNLALIGAQHESTNGTLTWVDAAQLPALTVQYDPDMPMNIEVPNVPGVCVLLFELGSGLESEWAPGLWTVKLRFDAGALNMRLTGAGLNGVPDPARPAGTAVIYEMQFCAKAAVSSDDEANFDLFQYQNAIATNDTAAMPPLDRILLAYPNDGNVRFARGKLLLASGRKSEALADAREVLRLAESGELRRPFTPPAQGKMNRAEAIEWLQAEIERWESLP